jgi:hypothetical protein
MAEEDLLTTAVSVEGKTIRLTAERWGHIAERHPELSGLRDLVMQAVAKPVRVLEGDAGERLAVREVEPDKVLVVVDQEGDPGGFIVTAFLTRRMKQLDRRTQRWP